MDIAQAAWDRQRGAILILNPQWGFPKIRGTFLGVFIIGIIVF